MTIYPHGIDNPTTLPPATGDDAVSVNANIAATEAIETELGILPSGPYASVRTRLDVLEARIGNSSTPGNVDNPFYLGFTGVSIQAGFGDPTITLPPAIPGSLYLREDGTNGQGLYEYRPDNLWHQISWSAGGDLSGTTASQTVIGIQGNPVQSGVLGIANDGYVLTWVNSAGMWEAKPTTFEVVDIFGDVIGTTAASTVVKIRGNPVSAVVPTAGQFLIENSTATGSAWTSLSGDVSNSAGTPGNITVTGIQTIPVSATAPTNQQALVYNGTNYVPAGIKQVFNVKNFGAIGNGIADDTTSVQNAINAAVAAKGTVYFPTGKYKVSSINVSHAIGLTIEGERTAYPQSYPNFGSTLQYSGGTSGTMFTFTDCQDVTVVGMHFWGNNPTLAASTSVGITCTSNNTPASWFINFYNCTFTEFGTCCYWSTLGNPYQCDKGCWEDCEFTNFINYGLYVNSANALDACRIEGCTFIPAGNNVAVGMYFFWSGLLCIRNCLGGGYHKNFIQINASLANNILIEGTENETGPDGYQVFINGVGDSSTFTFVNNSFTSPVYIGGIARVVGLGNGYFNGFGGGQPGDGYAANSEALILDGAGVKYFGYGDRFSPTGVAYGVTAVVTSNGGYFHNQGLFNASAYNELWSKGQVTWQPPYANETGCAAELCTRSGRRCQPWVANTIYPTGSYVQPTVDNRHVYFNFGPSGTSDPSTQPIWPTGNEANIVDGSVTWTEYGPSALFEAFAPLGHYTGTAIPTSGYFQLGNIVWNITPTSIAGPSSYAGWICTASGYPGTWAPFGPTTAGDITLAGDVTGPANANTVASISGASPIPITPANLQWTASTVSPLLSQNTPVSDVATTNLTIQSQAPYASASTHTSPGNLILKVPNPVGAGAYGFVDIANSSGNLLQIGNLVGQTGNSYAAIYPGAIVPSAINYAMYIKSDGTSMVLGGGVTTVNISANTNTVFSFTSSLINAYQPINFVYLLANPYVKHGAPVSDVATTNLTVQAQNAYASAVTNLTGGNLILSSGVGLTSTNNNGTVLIQSGGTTIASVNNNKFITAKGRRVNVTATTANPYNVLATDEIIAVGAIVTSTTINLPSSPTTGDIYKIKDSTGVASTYNIVISGNGNNIDNASTYTLTVNYSSLTVVFTGSVWSII